MQEVLRFGWLSESRRTALRSIIAREVAQWSSDWWVRHVTANVDVVPHLHGHARETNSEEQVCYSAGVACLALMLPGGFSGLGSHLANCRPDRSSSLPATVGEASIKDFSDRLARRAGALAVQPCAQSGVQPRFAPEYGGYGVNISLDGYVFELAIDRELADGLVAPSVIPSATLCPRREAMESVELMLEATLPLGFIALSELDGLKVGEILVGDRALDLPVDIRVADGAAVARGRLGKHENNRAVTLTHRSNDE